MDRQRHRRDQADVDRRPPVLQRARGEDSLRQQPGAERRSSRLDGTPPETCGHRPTIAEFLAGYGFTSRKPADRVAEGEVRARAWWELSRQIAAQATSKDLVLFADDKERDRARNKGLALEPRHLDADLLDSAETSRSLVETLGLAQDGGVPTGKIDKYQLQFLLGGWLEVFLWGLLDRHRRPLGIWDVRLGLEPMGLDSEVPNDFDVSFMRSYGLRMVECKTGEQEHDSGGEILYKIEAIIRQFRALHVRTVLATTSDNILKDGKVKDAIQNRARAYQCTILARDQIRHLATTDAPAGASRT